MKNRKEIRRNRRIIRVRKKIFGTSEKPRLCVFRSLRHIYAQAIDDDSGNTLASVSTLSPSILDELKGKKKAEKAEIVGTKIAEALKDKGIERVVFDRHGCLYHGRIKALAEGARKGGLQF
jgi:large subunit ribosomal protein L18